MTIGGGSSMDTAKAIGIIINNPELDRINENTTEVRHVKPYLLTALYNAPLTMDNHYALMVGHDLSGGSG